MWEAVVGKDFSAEDMANALLAVYDIDNDTALKDALHTMQEWKEIGLTE
jgi:hypothetical protein